MATTYLKQRQQIICIFWASSAHWKEESCAVRWSRESITLISDIYNEYHMTSGGCGLCLWYWPFFVSRLYYPQAFSTFSYLYRSMSKPSIMKIIMHVVIYLEAGREPFLPLRTSGLDKRKEYLRLLKIFCTTYLQLFAEPQTGFFF